MTFFSLQRGSLHPEGRRREPKEHAYHHQDKMSRFVDHMKKHQERRSRRQQQAEKRQYFQDISHFNDSFFFFAGSYSAQYTATQTRSTRERP